MDLAAAKHQRGVVKGTLTKALNYAKGVDRTIVSVQSLKNRRDMAASTFQKFDALQTRIEELCTEAVELQLQIDERDDIEERYLEIVTTLDEIIEEKSITATPPSPGPSPPHTCTPTVASVNVRLPAIELPLFEGNYADWTSFSDLFKTTIDSRAGLADAQKLQYLKTSMKGQAADLIKSLSITNDNYKTAWDILTQRYENQREIVHSLLRRLFSQPHMHKESASAFQKMLDTTREVLRALKVLKRPTEHWDDLIIYILVERLDSETRKQWALKQTSTNLSSLQELSEFLEQHARGIQANNISCKPSTSTDKKISTSHHGYAEMACVVCKSDHPIFRCEKFKGASPDERCNIAKKHRLCFNCLRSDHQRQACKSKSVCKICSKPHNSLLHIPRSNNATAIKQTAATSQTSVSPPESEDSHFTSGDRENTQVLLSTFVAKVKDHSGNDQHVRVLLDSGSQATMITEKCANALGLERQHSRVTVTGISSSSIGQTKGEVQLRLFSNTCDASISINALIFTNVTGILPKYICEKQLWPHIEGLQLADPTFHEPGPVDILLGADYLAAIMREGQRSGEKFSPIAQNTVFGWVLCGRVNIDCGHLIQSNHTHCELELIVKKFWELEQIPDIQHLRKNSSARNIFVIHSNVKVMVGSLFNYPQTIN